MLISLGNLFSKYSKYLLNKENYFLEYLISLEIKILNVDFDLQYFIFWLFLPNEHTREINNNRWCC